MNKLLAEIGDDDIMLQCDGYESMLNALESEDTDGRIAELVSPGDCSDIASMPDCEVGVFIFKELTKRLINISCPIRMAMWTEK